MVVPGRAEVEILYFIGCPAYRRARERVQKVLDEFMLPQHALKMTRVRSDREAARLGFHGSPTVRVNGLDVDPEGTLGYEAPGLYSREYLYEGKREDIPAEALLREVVAAALRGKRP